MSEMSPFWPTGEPIQELDNICIENIARFKRNAHLRRILKSRCYNGVRTHRSLNKDAPVSRSVQRAGSSTNSMVTEPMWITPQFDRSARGK
jgi:hypothetical protein